MSPPCVHVAILLWVGPVDQEQVDVLKAEPLGTVRERSLSVRFAMPPLVELRGHEDLVAVNAARTDASTDAGLVPIVLGRIDQAVAGPERGCHGRLRLSVAHRRGTEPERRHCNPVSERDGGDGGHLLPRCIALDAISVHLLEEPGPVPALSPHALAAIFVLVAEPAGGVSSEAGGVRLDDG